MGATPNQALPRTGDASSMMVPQSLPGSCLSTRLFASLALLLFISHLTPVDFTLMAFPPFCTPSATSFSPLTESPHHFIPDPLHLALHHIYYMNEGMDGCLPPSQKYL